MFLGEIDVRPMPPQIDRPPQVHDVLHPHQKLANVIQLPIAHVVYEARAIDRILGMEHVARGRIVNDDALGKVPVEQAQVLDVISLVKDARLTEESGAYDAVGIEQVEEDVGVLVEGCGVDDDLVVLGHLEEEVVHAGALGDVDEVDDVLDLSFLFGNWGGNEFFVRNELLMG